MKIISATVAWVVCVLLLPAKAQELEVNGVTITDLSIRFYQINPPTNDGVTFCVAETEVTNWQYRTYLVETGRSKGDEESFRESKVAPQAPALTRVVVGNSALLWKGNQYPEGRGLCPVVLIAPSEAEMFCRWLSKKYVLLGEFRLPTEAEWLLAAYGDNRKYPWGDDMVERAFQKAGNRVLGTHDVKKFSNGKTSQGIYGMWRNVSELTATLKDEDDSWAAIPAWMGGSYRDKDNVPRQNYWGFAHQREYKADDIGFRIFFFPKKRKCNHAPTNGVGVPTHLKK